MPDHRTPPPGSGQQANFTAASSTEVIARLAAHPAFALPQRPLTVGIRAFLIAAHPDIHPGMMRIALARTSSEGPT
jgi:hypothetical protein